MSKLANLFYLISLYLASTLSLKADFFVIPEKALSLSWMTDSFNLTLSLLVSSF